MCVQLNLGRSAKFGVSAPQMSDDRVRCLDGRSSAGRSIAQDQRGLYITDIQMSTAAITLCCETNPVHSLNHKTDL